MGGLTVLLSGPFRQTLPVVLRETRADIVKACLKTSFLWPHINVLSLKINMRIHLQHDLRAEMFSKLLIDIGDGKIKEVEGRINIPESLGNIVGDLITLTERIYLNIHQVGVDCSTWLKERAILTPTNDSANNINNFLLNKLTAKHAKY
ncbi:ATP-dependent DNA helicase [Trichonephila clavata]|uniref:ATP-dependent DNA helicase n=2 Tax=Trichonephila clavata TaxID=2740835 RepID=A0A8X6HF35_TRICU|nr:ATP-dependent DNA helicase [Trichonephila clavata]